MVGIQLEITTEGRNRSLDALKSPFFSVPVVLSSVFLACTPVPPCHVPLTSSVEVFFCHDFLWKVRFIWERIQAEISRWKHLRLPCTLINSLSKIFLFLLSKLFSDIVSNDQFKGLFSFVFTLLFGFQTGLFEHNIISLSSAIHS